MVAIPHTAPAVTLKSQEQVREQLRRILESKTFQQVERLKRFVRFIVSETLEGRGDQLKEFIVGVQVFDKEDSFDPRHDPIVRVQARRLRMRLNRYYDEEGQADELLIELPKGGYAPVFKPREQPSPKAAAAPALSAWNRISVLPFADHSPDGALDYFCKGLREEIIHTLAKVDTAWIASRDISQVAASGQVRPKAATFISGSVRKSGDQLRVAVQLIEGASGRYLWSDSLDRKMDNVFSIQEAVAQAVLKRLQAGPRGDENLTTARQITENLAAHNLYVQGRYHLNQRTEGGLRRAAEFFEKAIIEDPQYALGYSGLADAYGLLGHYGVMAPKEVWRKAASSAARAVAEDENCAEAHTSLALVKSTQDWDWLGAEQEFQRALQLDPRYPTAHHWYALLCLAPRARLDQALEELLQAQELDPISCIIARDLAVVHYFRRDLDAALAQCDHTIELNPHFAPAYWVLGLIQEQMEDFDESEAAFQRAIQLSPQSPRMHGALGRTLALCGREDEALSKLEELHRLAEKRYVSPFEIASIHFALQQTDQGFEWLRNAFRDRCFELISIKVDPRFDSIRSDPQFSSLSDQLKLQ